MKIIIPGDKAIAVYPSGGRSIYVPGEGGAVEVFVSPGVTDSYWPVSATKPQHLWPFSQTGDYTDQGSVGGVDMSPGGTGNSFSTGLVLNGSGFATTTNSADLNSLGATWSILFEVNTPVADTFEGLFRSGVDAISGVAFGVQITGTPRFPFFRTSQAGVDSDYTASSVASDANGYTGVNVTTGVNCQLIMTHSGGQTNLYCNGVKCKNSPQSQPDPVNFTGGGLTIGSWDIYGISYLLTGTIKRVGVLKGTAWSESDVTAIYMGSQ